LNTEPIPTYAYGYFFVHRSGLVDQIIVFEYHDPSRVYESMINDRVKYVREIDRLMKNMQYYLDQERVVINGYRVTPIVKNVEIDFKNKPDLIHIIFTIEFRGDFKIGLNTYENEYEEEIVEYEYVVYWFFPEKTRIVRAEIGVPYSISSDSRILYFKVKPGVRIGGREAIFFKIEE